MLDKAAEKISYSSERLTALNQKLLADYLDDWEENLPEPGELLDPGENDLQSKYLSRRFEDEFEDEAMQKTFLDLIQMYTSLLEEYPGIVKKSDDLK